MFSKGADKGPPALSSGVTREEGNGEGAREGPASSVLECWEPRKARVGGRMVVG
jgi:hypothetical protein